MMYDLAFDEQIKAHGIGTIVSQSSIVEVSLKQTVDEKALLSAMNQALLCHPLFCVKLTKNNGLYYWEKNTNPVILRQYDENHTLYFGNKDTNYYPWTILYEEKKIYLTTTHALTDGYGMVEFIKTVLYYYYAYFNIMIEDTTYIDTLDNMNDSTLKKRLELTNRVYGKNNSSNFQIKQPVNLADFDQSIYKDDAEPCSFLKIKLLKSQVSAYAAKNKVTTFASLSAISLKAMLPFIKNKDDNMSLLVAVDLRKVFNSKTMHNFILTVPLTYRAKEIENLSSATLQQTLRGDLTDVVVKEHVEKVLYDTNVAQDMLMSNPAMLDYMLQQALGSIDNKNATIVYTHLTKLNMPKQLEDLLENLEVTGFTSYPTPLFAIMGDTFKDYMNLTIVQVTKDNAYCKNFCEILDQEGFTYSCETFQNETRLLFETTES